MLVKPDGVGGFALGEKQQVGLDGGVRREHALGQADDGVQVALAQQQLFQFAFDAVPEHGAIRQHHRAAAAIVLEQFLDDQRHEHIGGFAGFEVAGVVGADAVIFIAAKRRIGDQAIDFLVGAPVVPGAAQRVAVVDLAGHVDAVQQHVGGAEQMRQLFLLDAVDQLFNGAFVVGAGIGR